MYRYFLLCSSLLLFAIAPSFGQTKEIAHQSHSGDPDQIAFNGSDNFGLIEEPRMVDSILRINDSTFVEIGRKGFRRKETFSDTIVNHWILNHPSYMKQIETKQIRIVYRDLRLYCPREADRPVWKNNLLPMWTDPGDGDNNLWWFAVPVFLVVSLLVYRSPQAQVE